MKESVRKIAFEFAEMASQHKILYIILFGSVLTEKQTSESDIDFFVVLDTTEELSLCPEREKIFSLANMLLERYNRHIHVTITNKKYEGIEDYFVQKVFGEGLILYATHLPIKINNISLKPYTFISYDLKKLTHSEKMKIRYHLFGHKEGLLKKWDGRKIGPGTFMIPTENLFKFENFLNRYNVLYKTINTWIYD
jgi:predicted nucleotidyltransferase